VSSEWYRSLVFPALTRRSEEKNHGTHERDFETGARMSGTGERRAPGLVTSELLAVLHVGKSPYGVAFFRSRPYLRITNRSHGWRGRWRVNHQSLVTGHQSHRSPKGTTTHEPHLRHDLGNHLRLTLIRINRMGSRSCIPVPMVRRACPSVARRPERLDYRW